MLGTFGTLTDIAQSSCHFLGPIDVKQENRPLFSAFRRVRAFSQAFQILRYVLVV